MRKYARMAELIFPCILVNRKGEIRKMIIFYGEGMIVCMNNLSKC
jgi:hypothetical protein